MTRVDLEQRIRDEFVERFRRRIEEGKLQQLSDAELLQLVQIMYYTRGG